MKSGLFILFIFLCRIGYSQEKLPAFSTVLFQPEVSYPLLHPVKNDMPLFQFSSCASLSSSKTVMQMPSVNHLPGMFCKLEYQIEKKSKLAPRFRLGSLEYTEWMEGKQDFYAPHYK